MNRRFVAVIASLIIHLFAYWAIVAGLQADQLQIQSNAATSLNLSISMFEISAELPERTDPTALETSDDPSDREMQKLEQVEPTETLSTEVTKKKLLEAPAPKPAPKPTPESLPETTAKNRQENDSEPSLHKPTRNTVESTTQAKTKKSADELQGVEHSYKESVRLMIQAQRKYPRKARRKKQEGEVGLVLVLKANGEILDIRIQSSSHVPSLDQAALDAVTSVTQYPPIPKALKRLQWTFEFPIVFNLSR